MPAYSRAGGCGKSFARKKTPNTSDGEFVRHSTNPLNESKKKSFLMAHFPASSLPLGKLKQFLSKHPDTFTIEGHLFSLKAQSSESPRQTPVLYSAPEPRKALKDRSLALDTGKSINTSKHFRLKLPWPTDPNNPSYLDVRLTSPTELSSSIKWLLQRNKKLLGVDVETDDKNEVQLLQLSTDERALLIRWSGLGKHKKSFDSVCELMADPSVLKVGCELRKDAIDILYDSGFKMRMRGGRDVTPALKRRIDSNAVYGLVEAFNARHGTDLVKDKNVTCSDWSLQVLSEKQLEYAALDAFMSYRLGCDAVLMDHADTRRIEIVEVSPALADSGRLLRECQVLLDASRIPVTSRFSAASWQSKAKDDLLQITMTHYENKLRSMDLVEVVFEEHSDNPWLAVAVSVKGKTAVLKPDTKPRKRKNGTVIPQLRFPSGALRPVNVKSVTIVGQDEHMLRTVYNQIKDLCSSSSQSTLVTSNLLGGRYSSQKNISVSPPPQPLQKLPPNLLSDSNIALNDAQARSVEDVVRGRPITLTNGPPGTGKTTTIAAVAMTLALGESVLKSRHPLVVICTQQNVAALNVLLALLRLGFTSVRLIVSGEYWYEWHEKEYDKNVLPFMYVTGKKAENAPNVEKGEKFAMITLVTFGLLNSPAIVEVLSKNKVGSVLVDEASQAWSGYSLLLDLAFKNLKRIHLFGDDRQLGPVLSPNDKSFGGIRCGKYVRSMYDEARDRGGAKDSLHKLSTQHRMPLVLARFISWHVYDKELHSAEGMEDSEMAVTWVDVNSKHSYANGSGSPSNEAEARAVCKVIDSIEQLIDRGHNKWKQCSSCVVITPYLQQRALIEAMCEHSSFHKGRWDVKTVDSYQGREADIVVLSLVKTDGRVGFMSDLRRVNVMLSRARKRLIIVGHKKSWENADSVIFKDLSRVFPTVDVGKRI